MQERFLNIPFLVEEQVSCVALDGRFTGKRGFPDLRCALERLGIRVVMVPPCLGLDTALCAHPDLQFHPVDGQTIVVAPNVSVDLWQQLEAEGFSLIEGRTILQQQYPWDIAYNVLRIGNLAFHNLKYTDPVLKEELEKRGVKFFSVKQGYSKCLSVILDRQTLLTEDEGIAKKARSQGLQVLCVKQGGILLPPFDTGFLGGSSGFFSKQQIVFTGNLSLHPEQQNMIEYLRKKEMFFFMLRDEQAWDTGSLIPLKERIPKREVQKEGLR